MVLPMIRALGAIPYHRLTYADYSPSDPTCSGQGFVYGWKEPLGWQFRVHSVSVKNKEVVTKLGYRTWEVQSIKSFKSSANLPSALSMNF